MEKPNPNNFCGGNFQDWLEVNLIDKCNGCCSWCIEKNNWHPKHVADWKTLAKLIADCDKTNIVLLGGEPTLHEHLGDIINEVKKRTPFKNIFLTTNGKVIMDNNDYYIAKNLKNLSCVNFSFHHWDRNKEITGIEIQYDSLKRSVKALHHYGCKVRFNCNCIKGYVDGLGSVHRYITFAKSMGADSVRLAELKLDEDHFVDLSDVFEGEFGLKKDPFIHGCNKEAMIDGIPVYFRQMCGYQVSCRPKHDFDFSENKKSVLYYNGEFYDGWQTKEEGVKMSKDESMDKEREIKNLLVAVAKKLISPKRAFEMINNMCGGIEAAQKEYDRGMNHCRY